VSARSHVSFTRRAVCARPQADRKQASQIFSCSAASGILVNDLIKIMEQESKLGFSAVPVDDNIYRCVCVCVCVCVWVGGWVGGWVCVCVGGGGGRAFENSY
jgi:hypothetical protein